jgi:excisionase family DNA binding protein
MANLLLRKVEQAADRLGLGRTIVWGLVSSGVLESVKIGRSRRVPVEALETYVAKLRADESAESFTWPKKSDGS